MDATTGSGRNTAETARASLVSSEDETTLPVVPPPAEETTSGAEQAPIEVDTQPASKTRPKKPGGKKADAEGLKKSLKTAEKELAKKAGENPKLSAALEAIAPKPRGRPKLTPFDPSPDQLDRLVALERAINAYTADDVQSKLGLGDLLNEAAAILQQHFSEWSTRKLQFSSGYIRNIRRVSRVFDEPQRQLVRASGLNDTAILELAEGPEELRTELLQRAAGGERLLVKDIKARVNEAKGTVPAVEGDQPGVAGLRAYTSTYEQASRKAILLGLGELRVALEEALAPNEKGRVRVYKAELNKATKAQALHVLVLLREQTGFRTFGDSPHFMHPVKYEDWPSTTGWGGVAEALLKLVELERRPLSETFAQDIEFEILAPLVWATTPARKVKTEAGPAANDDGEEEMAA